VHYVTTARADGYRALFDANGHHSSPLRIYDECAALLAELETRAFLHAGSALTRMLNFDNNNTIIRTLSDKRHGITRNLKRNEPLIDSRVIKLSIRNPAYFKLDSLFGAA